ncbi:serine/threonine protein kinase [Kitasatospora sp. KL5]|uniref:serine/threonine protein kinase n=1 Tax=Kitasatospora sp. KL5 TaxID=3425125 RepID=UPI003D6F19A5
MWGRGTVLGGRYALTDRVGVGGMGEVWRADDGVLKRQVAVKVMQPGLLADRSFTERFRREARILAALRHPGIVHVHDYAEPAGDSDEQIAYIVMEFIDGKPLNSVLAAEGPMVPARALGILADALDALHAAHQQDIVHRDLKPSNLMVRSDGGVTVTDFGIAHAMAGTKITTSNSVLGTALYIAPEQADGKSTTPLCDLYSIGVVCFELLTGRLPFTGETVLEIVLKHIQQPPPRLSDEFPRAVRDFVATALAKDPAQRFPDAGAMAAAARAAAARPGAGQAVREPTVFATVPEPVPREAPPAETPRTAPAERPRRSRLIVPIIIPVVISAGVGSVVLIEQAPWQSRAQGTGPQPSVAASVSPGAASAGASGTGGAAAASPPAGSATNPQAAPGQQPGNPVPDQGGVGAGGAVGGGAAGTGTGGGATNTGGTARPPANTPATTAPATTPAQTGPPQGCGGTGWGYITGVGSGQRLGLAASGLAGGTSAVVGRNTSYGWMRSAPDPGGWYSLYPCNMSKPGLVQNGDKVELSSGFSVTYRWTVNSAPTQGAVYLKDYSGSTCLTDNGAGSAATMQTCTPGNRSQQWFIPPSG